MFSPLMRLGMPNMLGGYGMGMPYPYPRRNRYRYRKRKKTRRKSAKKKKQTGTKGVNAAGQKVKMKYLPSPKTSNTLFTAFDTNERNFCDIVTNPFRQGGSPEIGNVFILDSDNSDVASVKLTATMSYNPGTNTTALVHVCPLNSTTTVGIDVTYPAASAGTPTAGTTAAWNQHASVDSLAMTPKSYRIIAAGLNIIPTSSEENTAGTIICANAHTRLRTAAATFVATDTVTALLNTAAPSVVQRGITLRIPPEAYNITFKTFDTNYYDANAALNYLPTAWLQNLSSTTTLLIRAVLYCEVKVNPATVSIPHQPSPSSLQWPAVMAIASSTEFPIVASGHSFRSFIDWLKSKAKEGVRNLVTNPEPALKALGSMVKMIAL